MLQQQDNQMKITRANILLADSIHRKRNIVKENNYVLAVPFPQPKKRLQAQWSGPYRVVEHSAGKCTNKAKMHHLTTKIVSV